MFTQPDRLRVCVLQWPLLNRTYNSYKQVRRCAADVNPPRRQPLHSTVPLDALHCMSAEEVRDFEAHLAAPSAAACGGVRPGDPAEEALARPGGTVCVGRVVDVLADEGRFYDTGEHVRARGMVDLPGACPVFRVAFSRGLVAAPLGGLASVDALPRDELLQVRAPATPPLALLLCFSHIRILLRLPSSPLVLQLAVGEGSVGVSSCDRACAAQRGECVCGCVWMEVCAQFQRP